MFACNCRNTIFAEAMIKVILASLFMIFRSLAFSLLSFNATPLIFRHSVSRSVTKELQIESKVFAGRYQRDAMKAIPLENLSIFEGIFGADKEKHVVILLTIKTFMQRFALHPELRERARLFALCDEWERAGIFFMTVSLFLRESMSRLSG
jgi:hypothetical protein